MRLNAPHDGSVTILVCSHFLFLVRLLGKLHDLAVGLFKYGKAAAYGHVVCFGVKRKVRAEHLRIGRLAHLKPLEAALGCVVYALCTLEVVVPIPLFAGVLFNESDGVADLLSGIFLNVLVHMAQRRCELEHGDTVLKLHTFGDDTVA